MTTLPDLLEDLDAEYDIVRAVVADLADDDPRWDLATPAEGWAVRDQISHLAYFDDAGRLAMVDPEAFTRSVDDLAGPAGSDGRPPGAGPVDGWRRAAGLVGRRSPGHGRRVRDGRPVDPGPLVRATDGGAVVRLGAADGDLGPRPGRVRRSGGRASPDGAPAPTSPTSASGRAPSPTWPGEERSLPVGSTCVLTAPDGTSGGGTPEPMTASDGAAGRSVRGTALDFCLVVTQRRNVADTGSRGRG